MSRPHTTLLTPLKALPLPVGLCLLCTLGGLDLQHLLLACGAVGLVQLWTGNRVALQPLGLVGLALALSASAHGAELSAPTLALAALLTGALWLLLKAVTRARSTPGLLSSDVLQALQLGLGLLMFWTGVQWMVDSPLWSTLLFLTGTWAATRSPGLLWPALLGLGLLMGLWDTPQALDSLIRLPGLNWAPPVLALPAINPDDVGLALSLVALPALLMGLGQTAVQRPLSPALWVSNVTAGLMGSLPTEASTAPPRQEVTTLMLSLMLIAVGLVGSDWLVGVAITLPEAALGVMLCFGALPLIKTHTNTVLSSHRRWTLVFLALCAALHIGLASVVALWLSHPRRRGQAS